MPHIKHRAFTNFITSLLTFLHEYILPPCLVWLITGILHRLEYGVLSIKRPGWIKMELNGEEPKGAGLPFRRKGKRKKKQQTFRKFMFCGPRPCARNFMFPIISKRLPKSTSSPILQNRELRLREGKEPIRVHMKKKRPGRIWTQVSLQEQHCYGACLLPVKAQRGWKPSRCVWL